ncbi:phage tail protein [Lactobacillus acidophilus]|uniref:tape measure protein n=1 Tax=Lactobacillus acidophilus TaxID=1579 RepID=UPI0021A87222|nr:tape measure protein [Lactobacillus acidophilus]MCT3602076.1 phage tail protein [Lactobacillus acidophilus]MCT3624389.1 phage tail protein [Lactobacillus acidophilus]
MAEISATIKINDAFSAPLSKLAVGLSKGQSGFSKLKSALSGDAFQGASKSSNSMFKSMTGGVVVGNLISKGMDLARSGISSMLGELNEASTSWQTFEGNMHQIGASNTQIAKAKSDMQKFAQQTIYSASDMSSTYAQLAAVGTKNTAKLVKGFGGLAAASDNPQQAMKTLSEQATQMAAKPKVQWQDFKLMLEQTPAGISAVAKTMGKSTTELIKNIQDGKVKTQDFLDAVAKTGTNANFSKMATQYKTVGQAADGLKETLANKLQPQFDKVSQVGIKAVSGITDKLANLNWDALGNGILSAISKVQPILANLGNGFKQMFEGFNSSGAGKSIVDMFDSIADAGKKLTATLSKGKGGNSFFKQLGSLGGGALSSVAQAISGVADAVGKMDPSSLMALARAFIVLKGGLKGIAIMAIVKGLQQLNGLSPGTIENIANALTKLAYAFVILKAVGKGMQMLKGIHDAFSNLSGLKTPKMATPEVPQAGGIAQSAGAYLKLGAALLMVGGAVVLAAAGFKLLADAATQLASGGGAAIATFFGMVAAIAALAVVVRLLGPAMIGASAGFLMFSAALLIIGAAIFVAAAGITLLATQLPIISQYGLSAAVGLLALAGAVAVFGVGALVAAVGVIVLGAGLIVLATGLMIAAVGALLFGVALTLIAAMSLVAGAGLMIMAVAMVMIAPMTLIAAVGMMMLSMALILVGPMAMVAAVGLMLLASASMMLAAGLAAVAAAAMMTAAAIVAVGTAVMTMVSMFIMAGSMMVSAITSAMSRVVSAVSSGIQAAVSAARGFVGALVGVGRDLIQGLINGITSMIGAAVSAVSKVASSVVSAAKGLLHIGSPSRLFRQYGRWVDQGLIIGLNKDAGAAANASANMAQGVVDAASGMHPTIGAPEMDQFNTGDLLADSFDRAKDSIYDLVGAITGLNGKTANVGVLGAITGNQNFDEKNISSSDLGTEADTITPASVLSSNSSTNTSNNQSVNIQSGAIVINSSGNPEEDADALLDRLEEKIMEQADKSLS